VSARNRDGRDGTLSRAPLARVTAPFGRRPAHVSASERVGPYTLLRVADPSGPRPQAGQFAMLAAAERWGAGEDERPYLPRALSFADWEDGEASFLLEQVGPGTRRLCELNPGDRLWMLGPLGTSFTAPEQDRRPLLVGGGIGIAPLIFWQRVLGDGATALLGFRDGPCARAATLIRDPQLVTDDGSQGRRGLVSDLLGEALDLNDSAMVYACGPPAMLEAVRSLCAERSVPAELALEAGMACGFGACYGCVVPRRDDGYLRVCLDGPVLDANELQRVEAYGRAAA
jgi:dihydroorotate dehydrogenase electron transfer subunit